MYSFDIAIYANSSTSYEDIAESIEESDICQRCAVFNSRDEILDSVKDFDFFVDLSTLDSDGYLDFLRELKDLNPDLSVLVSAAEGDAEVIGQVIKSNLGHVMSKEIDSKNFEEVIEVLKSETNIKTSDSKSRKLNYIFDKISESIYLKDRDGTYNLINQAAADDLGIDPDKAIGMKDSDFFEGEDLDDIRENDRKVMEDDMQVFNHSRRELNGEDIYFITSKKPYREDGEIKGVIGVSRDVTSKRKKERRLEAIFDNSRELTAIFDTDRTVLRVNETTAEVLGQDKEELEDVKFGEHNYFFSQERSKALFKRALEGETVYENVEVTVKGDSKIMEVSFTPIRDESDEVKSILFEAHNITELKTNERQLEAAFNSSYQMMSIIDMDGIVLRVNSAVEDFFDVNREQVIGRHYNDLLEFISNKNILSMYQKFIQDSHFQKLMENGFYRQEINLEKDDGQTAKLDVSLKAVNSEEGKMTAILAEARDVTKTKMDKRQLEDQKKRLERFSSIVSHDLRNPLNVASGYIELAKKSGEEEDFERAMNAIDRMDQIIVELLQISGKPEHFDKSKLELEEVFKEAYSYVDVEPEYEIRESTEFEGGHSGIVRMFENLIRNTAEHNKDAEIEIGAIENGFYYEDDGSIEKDIEEILEYGYSTSTEGKGLGLSVVQRVADINNWDLNITKNKNGSLRFEFLLEN